MQPYFQRTIDGWDSWGEVYQDRAAFLPLARAIYRQEGLAEPDALGALTPGTNAVFRCGDSVVKIYAPVESGLDSERDFHVELAMLRHVEALGIPTSRLLAGGQIRDRYLFRYLILAFVPGTEAALVLPGHTLRQRRLLGRQMGAVCAALNRPAPGLLPPVDIRQRALSSFRLDSIPPRLCEAFRARAQGVVWDEEVVVHGDLTGENVLIRADGAPVLLDMADAALAPACYELPALVFELFHCDVEMVRGFCGDNPAGLIPPLLDGLALHDFGPNIVLDWAQREHIPLDTLTSLDDIGARLLGRWL